MAPPKPKSKTKPTKKSTSKTNQAKTSSSHDAPISSLPPDLQQLLLNIFKNAFPETISSDLKPLLQEIKGHLYNRDFATAFGKESYLEAYALRWSPSRALCYLQIFNDLEDELNLKSLQGKSEEADTEPATWNVTCLGGGAGAEIVALAGLMKMLEVADSAHAPYMRVSAIDIADWKRVVTTLTTGSVTAPPISKYASAAVQAANEALTDAEKFSVAFHQHDVLNLEISTLEKIVQGADLVTLMFTLNELYTASLSLTQKFLLNLTTCLATGARLLVVDSPGSYSSVSLNGAEKKYPMQWLLDHTLLSTGTTRGVLEEAKWEKIKEEESTWFRLGEGLRYPIELEHMRYQLHLYQRLG